jgi:hypothetical protein
MEQQAARNDYRRSPVVSALLYSSNTMGLTTEQMWWPGHGTPAGFQLRRGARAEREGRQLTAAELAAAKTENEPGASRADLLAAVDGLCARSTRIGLPTPTDNGDRSSNAHRRTHPGHVAEAICRRAPGPPGVF